MLATDKDVIKYKNQFKLFLYVFNADIGAFIFGYFLTNFNPVQQFFYYNFNNMGNTWIT